MKSILFVDDEKQILRSLNRLFDEKEYQVILADSGAEALDILKNNTIDLVVSDVRMSGMSGFDLLKTVKLLYPNIIRIALSGYTETKEIYKALEANVAKMYIFKPWDNKDFQSIVSNLFLLEAQLKDKRILTVVNNMDNLPNLPDLYYRICDMIRTDEDVDKIAKVIENDVSTASKILRIANSAYYGAKTGSISQAILYIGLVNIRNVILTSSLVQHDGHLSKQLESIWNSATITNRFVTIFYSQFLGKKISKLFASAGLFHNIGMVIIIASYGTVAETILQAYEKKEGTLNDLEMQYIGITHQEIGGYLLNWWEMPLPLVEVAFYNESPLDERIINKELLSVTHLASAMASKRINPEEWTASPYLEVCCANLNLALADVDAFFSKVDLD